MNSIHPIQGAIKSCTLASIWCIAMLSGVSGIYAQTRTLTVRDLLSLVERQRPDLKALQERSNAAGYERELVRNTMVPDLNVGYQAGYATYNNLTGMTYPGLMPPVSGPVAPLSSQQMVVGSALAAGFLWTPLTFGQRNAAAERAAAVYRQTASEYENTLFKERYAAIRSYLEVIYLGQALQVQAANIERVRADLTQSRVLTMNGLRPGLDTAQFRSQLAQSMMDHLETRRSYTTSVLQLCRLAGIEADAGDLQFPDSTLAGVVPIHPDTLTDLHEHPMMKLQEDNVNSQYSILQELKKSWLPKLEIWGTAYSRGSGVHPDGTVHPTSGFQLQRGDYGAGAQLSFPILRSSRIGIQKKQATARVNEEKDRLSRISAELRMEARTAEAEFRERLLIAELAPERTEAAKLSYEGLRLSYESGLTDFTSLARGQQDLLQAQLAESSARLGAWKALLDIAVARGRLAIFTDQLTK